jgi:hypothetical protein
MKRSLIIQGEAQAIRRADLTQYREEYFPPSCGEREVSIGWEMTRSLGRSSGLEVFCRRRGCLSNFLRGSCPKVSGRNGTKAFKLASGWILGYCRGSEAGGED